MRLSLATVIGLCVLIPGPLTYAQLTSTNYQIDNYQVGTVEANNATSSNYQVEYANDDTFVYDGDDDSGGGSGGGGGGVVTDPDPDPVDPDPVDPDPVDPDPVDPDPVEPDPDDPDPVDPDPVNPDPDDPDPVDPDPVNPDPTDDGDDDGGGGSGGGGSDASDDDGGSGGSSYTPDVDESPEIETVEDVSVPETVIGSSIRAVRNMPAVQKTVAAVQNTRKNIAKAATAVKKMTPEAVLRTIEPTARTVTRVSESDSVEAATITSGLLVTLLSLLRVPFSISGLGNILGHLGSNILGLFAYSKRRRPWGTVYDSVSKYPLDPAYVELFDADGKSVATAITDLDGRYGFVVPEGEYTLIAKKSNYTFPSKRRVLTGTDVLYTNLYYGGPFTMRGSVALDIPMDPAGEDWNQIEKLRTKQMRFIHRLDPYLVVLFSTLFYVGAVLSVWQLFIHPGIVSFSLFILYTALVVVRFYKGGPLLYGTVKRGQAPLPYAVVRVKSGPAEIANKVTDEFGRYVAIVPPGMYTVVVEERTGEESYTTVYQSIQAAKKGIINDTISVSQ